jgi:hypothetical protein
MMKCDSVAVAVGLEGREDDVYCVAQQHAVKPRRLKARSALSRFERFCQSTPHPFKLSLNTFITALTIHIGGGYHNICNHGYCTQDVG